MALNCDGMFDQPMRLYPSCIIEIEVSDKLDLTEEDVIWLEAMKVGIDG